jgi:hypothetical protein
MANVIPENTDRFFNPDDFESQVREYALIKKSMATMEQRSKELRDQLFEYIDTNGDAESEVSVNLYLDHEIEGLARIQKQGRVTRKLNEEIAEAIIEETGIGDDVYEMKRVINEDALMACLYQDKITEEQLDAMFPRSITWALITKKN